MTSPSSADWMRPLGSTGLQVSAVCAGGAPLGSMPENFGYEVSYADGVALVGHILDSPIRMLDTANGYSGGESERRIGAGIAAFGGLPADFLVATKVDARNGDYSGERVRASVAESKERLGLDFLALGLPARPGVLRLRRDVETRRCGGNLACAPGRRSDRACRPGWGNGAGDVALPGAGRFRGGTGPQPLDARRPQRRRLDQAGGGSGCGRGQRRDLWRWHPGQPGRWRHQLRLPSS